MALGDMGGLNTPFVLLWPLIPPWDDTLAEVMSVLYAVTWPGRVGVLQVIKELAEMLDWTENCSGGVVGAAA